MSAAAALGATPRDSTAVKVTDSLDVIAMTPRAELEAFIERIVPIRAISRRMLRSRTFGYVTAALPGLEAFLLLERLRIMAGDAALEDRYVVIDAPASGSAVEMLSVSSGVKGIAPAGTLNRLADSIDIFLADPTRFGAVITTTPEDLAIARGARNRRDDSRSPRHRYRRRDNELRPRFALRHRRTRRDESARRPRAPRDTPQRRARTGGARRAAVRRRGTDDGRAADDVHAGYRTCGTGETAARFAKRNCSTDEAQVATKHHAKHHAHREPLDLPAQSLVICLGPGGVGKTTISAALAVRAAMLGCAVDVMTVDPAPRLLDALGLAADSSEPVEVPSTASAGRDAAAHRIARGCARCGSIRSAPSIPSSRATRCPTRRATRFSRIESIAICRARSRASPITWRWKSCSNWPPIPPPT